MSKTLADALLDLATWIAPAHRRDWIMGLRAEAAVTDDPTAWALGAVSLAVQQRLPRPERAFMAAGRCLVAVLCVSAAALLAIVALGSGISLGLKVMRPDSAGVWVAPGGYMVLGAAAHSGQAHEIAGNWAYLLFAALIVICLALARYSVGGALHMVRHIRPGPGAV